MYPAQRFQSDSERRFAVVLENDSEVIKWFKPGKGAFQIDYRGGASYEPDFVVETRAEKFICETKAANETDDSIVQAKADAAYVWCEYATQHAHVNNGKPWSYLLIPHDIITEAKTLQGLAAAYGNHRS